MGQNSTWVSSKLGIFQHQWGHREWEWPAEKIDCLLKMESFMQTIANLVGALVNIYLDPYQHRCLSAGILGLQYLLVILRPESQLHLVLGLGCFIVTWSRRLKAWSQRNNCWGLLLRFMFTLHKSAFFCRNNGLFVQECSRHVQVKKVYQFHPFIHNSWSYSIQFEAAILASHSCISWWMSGLPTYQCIWSYVYAWTQKLEPLRGRELPMKFKVQGSQLCIHGEIYIQLYYLNKYIYIKYINYIIYIHYHVGLKKWVPKNKPNAWFSIAIWGMLCGKFLGQAATVALVAKLGRTPAVVGILGLTWCCGRSIQDVGPVR